MTKVRLFHRLSSLAAAILNSVTVRLLELYFDIVKKNNNSSVDFPP